MLVYGPEPRRAMRSGWPTSHKVAAASHPALERRKHAPSRQQLVLPDRVRALPTNNRERSQADKNGRDRHN